MKWLQGFHRIHIRVFTNEGLQNEPQQAMILLMRIPKKALCVWKRPYGAVVINRERSCYAAESAGAPLLFSVESKVRASGRYVDRWFEGLRRGPRAGLGP